MTREEQLCWKLKNIHDLEFCYREVSLWGFNSLLKQGGNLHQLHLTPSWSSTVPCPGNTWKGETFFLQFQNCNWEFQKGHNHAGQTSVATTLSAAPILLHWGLYCWLDPWAMVQLLLSSGCYQHIYPLREQNFIDLMSEETIKATYFHLLPHMRKDMDTRCDRLWGDFYKQDSLSKFGCG